MINKIKDILASYYLSLKSDDQMKKYIDNSKYNHFGICVDIYNDLRKNNWELNKVNIINIFEGYFKTRKED